MQFKVPQDVQQADRIVSFLTLPQLIICVIGFAISYGVYAALNKQGLPMIFWLPPVIIIASITLAFAFLKIANLPFHQYLALLIERFITPSKRVWVKGGDRVISDEKYVTAEEKKTDEKKNTLNQLQQQKAEKIQNITEITDVLDTLKKEVPKNNEQESIDQTDDKELLQKSFLESSLQTPANTTKTETTEEKIKAVSHTAPAESLIEPTPLPSQAEMKTPSTSVVTTGEEPKKKKRRRKLIKNKKNMEQTTSVTNTQTTPDALPAAKTEVSAPLVTPTPLSPSTEMRSQSSPAKERLANQQVPPPSVNTTPVHRESPESQAQTAETKEQQGNMSAADTVSASPSIQNEKDVPSWLTASPDMEIKVTETQMAKKEITAPSTVTSATSDMDTLRKKPEATQAAENEESVPSWLKEPTPEPEENTVISDETPPPTFEPEPSSAKEEEMLEAPEPELELEAPEQELELEAPEATLELEAPEEESPPSTGKSTSSTPAPESKPPVISQETTTIPLHTIKPEETFTADELKQGQVIQIPTSKRS